MIPFGDARLRGVGGKAGEKAGHAIGDFGAAVLDDVGPAERLVTVDDVALHSGEPALGAHGHIETGAVLARDH
jgi:hypothetical protein